MHEPIRTLQTVPDPRRRLSRVITLAILETGAKTILLLTKRALSN